MENCFMFPHIPWWYKEIKYIKEKQSALFGYVFFFCWKRTFDHWQYYRVLFQFYKFRGMIAKKLMVHHKQWSYKSNLCLFNNQKSVIIVYKLISEQLPKFTEKDVTRVFFWIPCVNQLVHVKFQLWWIKLLFEVSIMLGSWKKVHSLSKGSKIGKILLTTIIWAANGRETVIRTPKCRKETIQISCYIKHVWPAL